MFAEISVLALLQGAALLAIGVAAGYFLANAYLDRGRSKLEEELEKARAELAAYRSSVDSHFIKTSQLFNRLTDDYREIYEHLATGAEDLCSQTAKAGAPHLDRPETRHLPAIEAGLAEAPVAMVEAETEGKVATETVAEKAKGEKAEGEAGDTQVTEAAGEGTEAVPSAETVPLAQEAVAEEVPMGAEAAPAPSIAKPERPTQEEDAKEAVVDDASELGHHRPPPSIH